MSHCARLYPFHNLHAVDNRDAALPKVFALARVPRGSHPFVQRLRKLVLRLNVHARCDPKACGKRCSQDDIRPPYHPDRRCAKGYPFPDSSHECDDWCPRKDGVDRCRLGDRHECTRLRHEDARDSPFHPIAFAAYPTHDNDQVVTKTSFVAYLVKYTAKFEPQGKVSNPLDAVDASQLPRAGREQDGLQSVNQKQLPYIWGRGIALSEATLILAGQSMCLKSRVYKVLDTKLSHLRRVVVQRGEDSVTGNARGGVVGGMIEKCAKRPQGLISPANVDDDGMDVDFDLIGYREFWEEWEVAPAGSRNPPKYLPRYYNDEGTCY